MPRDPVTVRRNGPYAPLSATYADDDAIATLDHEDDDRTELLYVRGLAYCAREPKREGFISTIALQTGRVLNRKSVKVKVNGAVEERDVIWHAERLVKLDLWQKEPDGYRVRSWKKWNRTPDEIEAARKKDRDRKTDGDSTDDGL